MRALLIALLLLPGAVLAQDAAPPPAQSPAAPAAEAIALPEPMDASVPLDEIRRYVGVFRAVKDAYVDPISDQELMRRALRGLLADLDPHSAYLERDSAQELNELTTGRYVGIGVELELRAGRELTVVAPVDGGPAAKAGIQSGDIIVAIDDKPIVGQDVDSASRGLKGLPGTSVKVRVRRAAEEPRDLTLVRAEINVKAVSGRILEPGFGYLRISSFQSDTGLDVAARVRALVEANGSPLRGLLLDLRSNPGGVLSAAVSSADVFLDGGLVVRSRGRLATSNAAYHANPGDLLEGAPIVALIDSGTASAAEVLAGALQDHKRAKLVGSRSFGKGSIQSVVPLANGDAVKLTTGRYYTPDGHSIQARGLTPDVPLAGDRAAGVREQDLPGHLAGADEAADGYARGEVLVGDAPITAALVELKKLVR